MDSFEIFNEIVFPPFEEWTETLNGGKPSASKKSITMQKKTFEQHRCTNIG